MENEKKLKQVGVPMVKMRLKKGNPSVFESKVGGIVGYLLKGEKIPTDSKGNQLRLLAQINCKDVDLEEFPKEGILQFWILNDDMYGCDFNNQTKQDTFRIIYHEQIDESIKAEDILTQVVKNDDEYEYFPVESEFGIRFEKTDGIMSDCDYRFKQKFMDILSDIFPEELEWNEDEEIEPIEDYYDVIDELYDDINKILDINRVSDGHSIGGYPCFTQGDPRTDDNYDYLLFQLDSESDSGNDYKVLWGDLGVGNFFINKQKLINKDFSDVLYNWDCG